MYWHNNTEEKLCKKMFGLKFEINIVRGSCYFIEEKIYLLCKVSFIKINQAKFNFAFMTNNSNNIILNLENNLCNFLTAFHLPK